MRDYKEIAREVFAKRDEYLIKQKKRRKAVATAASLCVALCVVVGVAVGYQRAGNIDGGVVGGMEVSGIDSIMVTPTAPLGAESTEPTVNGTSGEFFGSTVGDPYKGTTENAADRAGAESSNVVVYGEITSFDQIGTDILCTLSVERTLKGEEADTVSFNISEEDREGYMALIKGEKAVFFLSEGENGLYLTHGSPSIFYEAGEDDYRSYDEIGLICYSLTMSEIERLTEVGT